MCCVLPAFLSAGASCEGGVNRYRSLSLSLSLACGESGGVVWRFLLLCGSFSVSLYISY